MRTRKVLLKLDADDDLRQIREFVSSIYRKESGINYVKRLFREITILGVSADAFPLSRYQTALKIHPEAKTLSILNHRWTVVFHIEGDYVIVDRILPSSAIVE